MGKGHKTRHNKGVKDIGQECLEEFEKRRRRGLETTVVEQLPIDQKYNSDRQPLSKYDYNQGYRR